MMTFYEELGVPAEASREELRQAYRRLARLLHPDRCLDPATRLLAELQMRRLNGILELLGNPEQRASYDRSLAEVASRQRRLAAMFDCRPVRPPLRSGSWWDVRVWRPRGATAARTAAGKDGGQSAWNVAGRRLRELTTWRDGAAIVAAVLGTLRSVRGEWWHRLHRRFPAGGDDAQMVPGRDGWRRSGVFPAAAASVGVVGLLVFCILMPSSPPLRAPVVPAIAPPRQISPPKIHRAPRSRPRLRAGEAMPAPLPEHSATGSPALQSSPLHTPDPAESLASRALASPGNDPPSEDRPHRLAGDWFFVPTSETRKGGYPPEYIELRLVEKEGVLQGRYRARYRIADRAISPTVAFQFEGRAAAEGGVLPWRGPGGAQGEISLRLLANGNLEVDWAAGQMGEELGLISGTATLVRRLE